MTTFTYRLRNILIAAALAVTAVTLTVVYVASSKHDSAASRQPISVFVATRDIPLGTPSAQLGSGGYIKRATVSSQEVAPGAIRKLDEIRGLSASQPIYAGEQVTARRFDVARAQGIRLGLTGTQRAVQIPGEPSQLLAGTLQEGDHVDVVASLTYPEGSGKHFSRVIVRDLLVLKAPDKDSSSKLTSGSASATAVLALTDEQAQRVFYAVENGDWSLLLRPVKRPADSSPSIDSAGTVLTNHGRQLDLLLQAGR